MRRTKVAQRRPRAWILIGGIAALTVLVGCRTIPGTGRQESVPYLDNFSGSAREREMYFHLPEGSEVIPLRLLKSLKSVETGKPFLQDIERLGYLSDPSNRDGLAIGMAKGPATLPVARVLGDSVGFNCAACHTAEFHHEGKRFRVLGAPAKADFDAFANDLAASGRATLLNPVELVNVLIKFGFPDNGANWSQQALASPSLVESSAAMDGLGTQELTSEQAAVVEYLQKLSENPEEVIPIATSTDHSEAEQAAFKANLEANNQEEMAALSAPVEVETTAGASGTLQELVPLWKAYRGELPTNDAGMAVPLDGSVTYSTMEAFEEATDTGVAIGRVDAFGKARKVIFRQEPSEIAPVSYPPIWNIPSMPWLHFDGNTTSVTERNVGQAIGVQASFNRVLKTTSANVANIVTLEGIAGKITPPKWPEDILGKLQDGKGGRLTWSRRGSHSIGRTATIAMTSWKWFTLKRIPKTSRCFHPVR